MPPPTPGITRYNQTVLDAITAYVTEHGYAPSLTDLKAATGINSKSTIVWHLDRLAAAGAITRAPGVSRGIVIVTPEETADA